MKLIQGKIYLCWDDADIKPSLVEYSHKSDEDDAQLFTHVLFPTEYVTFENAIKLEKAPPLLLSKLRFAKDDEFDSEFERLKNKHKAKVSKDKTKKPNTQLMFVAEMRDFKKNTIQYATFETKEQAVKQGTIAINKANAENKKRQGVNWQKYMLLELSVFECELGSWM